MGEPSLLIDLRVYCHGDSAINLASQQLENIVYVAIGYQILGILCFGLSFKPVFLKCALSTVFHYVIYNSVPFLRKMCNIVGIFTESKVFEWISTVFKICISLYITI